MFRNMKVTWTVFIISANIMYMLYLSLIIWWRNIKLFINTIMIAIIVYFFFDGIKVLGQKTDFFTLNIEWDRGMEIIAPLSVSEISVQFLMPILMPYILIMMRRFMIEWNEYKET